SVSAGLNRVVQTLQQDLPSGATGAAPTQSPSMPDFLRSIFSSSQATARFDGRAATAPSSPLVAQLDACQKTLAKQASGEAQPGSLREQLDLEKIGSTERMTVEVITMLFEIIQNDEQIPPVVRSQIGRLQVPMLKAALLDSTLLHDDGHPARRLLNRLSTAAAGCDPASASGRALVAEIARVVQKVLEEFDADSAAFSNNLADFERFLGALLREEDRASEQASEAIEAAEKYSVLLSNTTRALCDVLLPLNIDKRISDFIITVWPHVLVRAAWQDVQQGGTLCEQYRAVLPELIWSLQSKEPQERTVLIKLLPDLVRRLRAALQLIELPQDEAQPVLDLLVTMHGQVLHGTAKPSRLKAGLEELRQQFAPLTIRWEHVSWTLPEPPQVREAVVEDVLARLGVEAELNLLAATAASAADREFLSQTYLLGTRVELRTGRAPRSARLVWVATHRSLYLFRCDDGALAVFSAAALLEALGAQQIVPLEYAPVFERAVESLLFGAEKLGA
ncbi:MAG TPA: DUF1631 family protein, partial [Noviherbaspirillum sp.]